MIVLCATAVRAQDNSFPSDPHKGQRAKGQGLLMVHFGTTYDETRLKTIDAINEKARQAFPDYEFAEAYTSRVVARRLAERGIVKPSVTDALLGLRATGCRRVVVQPTYVIDGTEMQRLRSEVEQVRPFFDDIQVGTPLLYSVEDCQRVCDILTLRHPADPRRRGHVVFIGHGTEGPATALYSQLDYMLAAAGHAGYHVATIEGYPTLQTVTARLKQQRAKTVTLVPLLFVAGDHATNDISVAWREALEHEGFTVRLCIEGLGEVAEMQNLYIEKAK